MILAIVQARMSSNRLPEKVMKEILGKPMIGHLLERLALSKRIDKIILATSVRPENDPLEQYVNTKGIDVYRGDENDVLDRFYQAAKKFNPYAVVRITGDCPLFDPEVCDRLIDVFINKKLDYIHTGPTFAEGLDCEALTFQTLKTLWKKASLKSEREHVTLFLHNHPELFKKETLINPTDDSHYRFSVDQREDFFVVSQFLEFHAKTGGPIYTSNDVKAFFDSHPSIARLNANIVRNEGLLKSLKEEAPRD